MSERIDAKLESIKKLGQKPKTIFVGTELYFELYREQNLPHAADVLRDGQVAPVHSNSDVTTYKGIDVVLLDDVKPNYLEIRT